MPITQNLSKIKSYAQRKGRISISQQNTLNSSSKYLLATDTTISNREDALNQHQKIIIEIGFGNGSSLLTQAVQNPNTRFIGIEVYQIGIANVLTEINNKNLSNICIYKGDATDFFNLVLPENTIDAIQIFFPDPWPKLRHHKRRLINREFVSLLISRLIPGGWIHIASDWQHYAKHIHATLSANTSIANQAADNWCIERPATRPLTKYEARGISLGHKIYDFLFHKHI